MSRKRIAVIVAIALGIVAVVVGLVVFKPWLLFVDVRVDEAIPTAVAPLPTATSTDSAEPAVPVEVATGSFISHEHTTTGTARIIENPDGTRVLALENLDTSNGPDVHVWLSEADVVEGADGWFTAGSAAFVDLGLIKGNQGNQLYDIPASVDLTRIRSVDLWCVQFSVSFGAAQLG